MLDEQVSELQELIRRLSPTDMGLLTAFARRLAENAPGPASPARKRCPAIGESQKDILRTKLFQILLTGAVSTNEELAARLGIGLTAFKEHGFASLRRAFEARQRQAAGAAIATSRPGGSALYGLDSDGGDTDGDPGNE